MHHPSMKADTTECWDYCTKSTGCQCYSFELGGSTGGECFTFAKCDSFETDSNFESGEAICEASDFE